MARQFLSTHCCSDGHHGSVGRLGVLASICTILSHLRVCATHRSLLGASRAPFFHRANVPRLHAHIGPAAGPFSHIKKPIHNANTTGASLQISTTRWFDPRRTATSRLTVSCCCLSFLSHKRRISSFLFILVQPSSDGVRRLMRVLACSTWPDHRTVRPWFLVLSSDRPLVRSSRSVPLSYRSMDSLRTEYLPF